VVQARREAMAADLVVVNHHLFFADMALRDSGVAELLPTVDAAVFDEAHQLVEAGVQFLGPRWAPAQAWTWRATCWPWACSRPAAWRPGTPAGRGSRSAARDLRLALRRELARRARPAQAALGRARAEAPSWRCAAGLGAALPQAAGAGRRGRRSAPDFPKLRAACAGTGALVARLFKAAGGRMCAGSTCRRSRRGWSSRRWTSATC
jgi:ATP-dependent DNA helicase DinG